MDAKFPSPITLQFTQNFRTHFMRFSQQSCGVEGHYSHREGNVDF